MLCCCAVLLGCCAAVLLCCCDAVMLRLDMRENTFMRTSGKMCSTIDHIARICRKCAGCGCNAAPSVPVRLCSGCKCVGYCSTECQHAAWRDGHKAACPILSEMRSLPVNVATALESGSPEVLPAWCYTLMLPNLPSTRGFTLTEHTMTMSLCFDPVTTLRFMVLVGGEERDTPHVALKGPFVYSGLSFEVVNALNILRAYTPTLVFFDTLDHLDSNGHLRLRPSVNGTWTLKPGMASKYMTAMRFVLSFAGAALSSPTAAAETHVMMQLRMKQARGYTHVLVDVDGTTQMFALEQDVLVDRIKHYLPEVHSRLKADLA